MEVWKDVKDFEGLYQVSNYGRIKTLGNCFKRKEKIRKLSLNPRSGYMQVELHKNGKESKYYVHRLVADAFLENPDNLPCVNHKDCNRVNNHADNLEYISYQNNVNYKDAQHKRVVSFREKYRNPIKQLTKSGEYIKTHNTPTDAAKELGIDCSQILNCCNHKKHFLSAGGYKWEWETV